MFRLITNILFTGDSMSYHNNKQFSTKDQDNDERSSDNCAVQYHGGFWYRNCHHTNLNGEYLRNGASSAAGVRWWHWKRNYSMKQVEMKIKPN